MKKLVSLVMVLALVLCMATVAFAEETTAPTGATHEDPIVVDEVADLAAVDVDMYATKWFKLPKEWSGKVLTVSAPMSVPAIYVWSDMWGGYAETVGQGTQSASYYLDGDSDFVIGIGSGFGYVLTGAVCTLEDPVAGSEYKPAAITDLTNPVSVSCMETAMGPMYYMSYTAGEAGGDFTISNVQGNFYQIVMETESGWAGYYSDSTEATIGMYAGETVDVVIMGDDLDPVSFDAAFTAHEKGASEYNPIVIEDKDKDYTFEVTLNEDGAPVYYALADVNGAILTINDSHAYIYGMGYAGVYELDDGNDDVLTVQVEVYGDSDTAAICVGSYSATDTKYTVTVSEPEGYDENPEELKDIDEINVEIPGGVADFYYYQWIANETGKVTLSVTGAEWTEVYKDLAVKEYAQIWDEDYQDYVDNPISWYDVPVQLTVYVNGEEVVAGNDAVVFDVNKNDVVVMKVQTLPIYEYETYGYGAYVDIAGTVDALGSANNPIVINNAFELGGVDVSANGETYVAINSQLNGQVLTIVGNANTVVTLNGTALQSNNGVFVAELTGAPTNALVVSNTGNNDASYVASISWPEGSESNPAAINATGDYTASVAAGKEVFYAVNAKLNGAVLTVKNASYVIVDGTKYEAKNGVVTATLKSTAATISVVVGNSGTADVSAKLTVALSDNPKTGDAGILMPVVTALVSAMGVAALVIKKKEN